MQKTSLTFLCDQKGETEDERGFPSVQQWSQRMRFGRAVDYRIQVTQGGEICVKALSRI